MVNSIEAVPVHMQALVNETDDLALIVRQLNCFCVAALFHEPELLKMMGREADANFQIAEDFLFGGDRFSLVKKGRLDYGTINLFFPARYLANLPEHLESIFHVSVNLGGWNVLTKYGSGASKIAAMSYDNDVRWQRRFGGGDFATALLVPNMK